MWIMVRFIATMYETVTQYTSSLNQKQLTANKVNLQESIPICTVRFSAIGCSVATSYQQRSQLMLPHHSSNDNISLGRLVSFLLDDTRFLIKIIFILKATNFLPLINSVGHLINEICMYAHTHTYKIINNQNLIASF